AIAHLQETVHARPYRSSFVRCPGGGRLPLLELFRNMPPISKPKDERLASRSTTRWPAVPPDLLRSASKASDESSTVRRRWVSLLISRRCSLYIPIPNRQDLSHWGISHDQICSFRRSLPQRGSRFRIR